MCSKSNTGTLSGVWCLIMVMVFFLHCAPPGAGIIKKANSTSPIRNNYTSRTVEYSWHDGTGERTGRPSYVYYDGEYLHNEYGTSFSEKPDQGHMSKSPYLRSGTVMQKYIHPDRETPRENKNNSGDLCHGAYKTRTIAGISTVRYRVKKGDTLYSISRKYGCPVSELLKINRLKKKNIIYSGMILSVPVNKCVHHRPVALKRTVRSTDKGKPRFSWPVSNIISVKRDGRQGVKPIGIEITAKPGSPVRPSATGIVSKIGTMRGYGKYIIILHDSRYVTVYANITDVNVNEGDKVRHNSIIARIDDRCSILFQIGRSGKPVNPLRYLPKRG